MTELVSVTSQGLYCQAGGFYIDPWRPVERAILTHAHSDHARPGSQAYWATDISLGILNHRLHAPGALHGLAYGEKKKFGKTWVSLHPAGHVLGSAQVRIESGSDVWVISGDYKRAHDPSCDPFEPVKCDTFITESTFGLPIYHWEDTKILARQIFEWWQNYEGPSILFCYAFGKAQRVLAELHALTSETVYVHGAVQELTEYYRKAGVQMVPTQLVTEFEKGHDFKKALIIAPPSAHRSAWMKRFKEPQTAFASGWMLIRGNRRRRGYETGFVLSDHADWNGLVQTVKETGAKKVYVTHGQNDVFARYLREEMNIDAQILETLFEDDEAAS